MGIKSLAKKVQKGAGAVKTAVVSTPKAAKTFGSTLVAEGKKDINTPGSEANRFVNSPLGFTAYAPKPVRSVASFVAPTPKGVVNSTTQAVKNPNPKTIGTAAYDIGSIAALPLAASGAARGASAFARAPRVTAITRALSAEEGFARLSTGRRLKTAAEIATTRARVPRTAPGAAVASATQRLEAAASGVKTAATSTARVPSGMMGGQPAAAAERFAGARLSETAARVAAATKPAAKVPGMGARIGSRIAKAPVKAADALFISPARDVRTAAVRLRSAKGIGGKTRAALGVAAHTPGFALKTSATATASYIGAAAVKETARTLMSGNRSASATTEPEPVRGLKALAKVREKKGQAGVDAILRGFEDVRGNGLMVMSEEKAHQSLRKAVAARYAQAKAAQVTKPLKY